MADQERRELLGARLPRRAREALALRYYLDLPDREIAEAPGVSRGTVSSTSPSPGPERIDAATGKATAVNAS